MLIIDPDLHNPSVNGIPLMTDGRINPLLALTKDDIFGTDGIVVEKFQDGTIRISADLEMASEGEYKKYLSVKDIDFMSSLPSVFYKFLNTFLSKADFPVCYAKDYSVSREASSLKPPVNYSYDINGNAGRE